MTTNIPVEAAMDPEIERFLDAAAGHVHGVGVCGIGMAGLAILLRARGFAVSGCDRSAGRMAQLLRGHGIRVDEGHAAAHIAPDVRWVIASAAVPPDAPDLRAARAAGRPVFRRGLVLAALVNRHRGVAVCGSHGKTTTTTFTAQLLRQAGLRPGWCIGGESDLLGASAAAPAAADGLLVVEADESDGTLASYRPECCVLTNIEFDHAEHFADVAALEACFRAVARSTRGRVIYCVDDPRAAALGRASERGLAYGLGADAAVRAIDLAEGPAETSYTLVRAGRPEGRVTLPAPGRHNVLNSLAAACVGFECGLDFAAVRAGLAQVGLPHRRFETVAAAGGVRVVSDYAHHPTEIAAAIRIARGLRPARLLAVFQPHRYSRTRALGPDFPAAFRGVDELVLLPVYAASETPCAGGTSWDLYARFRAAPVPGVPAPRLARSLAQAWAYLRRALRPGDLLLVVGAGDVETIAGWARSEWAAGGAGPGAAPLPPLPGARVDEPLAPRTTFRVGGCADVYVELADAAALAGALRWTRAAGVPFTLMGGGCNVLVSDLGVRGVVARLTGPVFTGLRREGGEAVVGAAVPMARLTAWLEQEQLGGAEFLEGVPGTVGGALRMNAGAWGHAIGERVAWVRGVDRDGTERRFEAADMDFGYRHCGALRERVAVEAGLRLWPADPAAIRAERAAIAAKRGWMKGIRSAGSVFRNPPGGYAGKLIEEAGLKGDAIGGARIMERHANVIAADEGATASDVLALIERMRATVRAHSGVTLEPEVVLME